MIRVLVADDHPIVRSGVVALLGSAPDIEVVGEASDGGQAVDLALALRPDLVLMDLRMPVLNGDEATARILAAAPEIRILVLTTYETDDTILTAIEAGASGYLMKAAPQEEILTGVRAVARGEVALAPSIAALLVRQVAGSSRGLAAAAAPAPVVALTDRETEVLAHVAQGHSNRATAEALFVSEATVKTHLLHIFEKLDVRDRTRAVTLAMELGLLPR
jgi:DNA-binding NarL/FixJ family response regulator